MGNSLRYKTFYDEIPVHVLVRRLDAGAFQHGLRREFPPDFGALFRRLLKDRKIEMKERETDETIVKVHHYDPEGCVIRFPLHSMKRVFPGSLDLGTACPFSPPLQIVSRGHLQV